MVKYDIGWEGIKMQSINNRERITVIALYQKLMVFLIAALIVGNTFQYEPSYYLLLVI